ncbi:MAG TPA: glycoside hydrolase family 172 protein, partial [Ktedonobacteraceae bacterium]|nr:glycoside hydrolase family 172 protein [Ktedonobacteraceae bacterium]
TAIPDDVGYFHAQWRRSNPLRYKEVHTLLDNVQGQGQYVGTYIAWQVNSNGWWGEGEIKFYLDGDQDFPTICGTGTEDYFGGAWNFEQPPGQYQSFSTPFLGLPQIILPNGLYRSQQRFGMYRWHIMDPIRFAQDLRVTIQGLGWRSGHRYLPLQDDIASTSFWYQTEPHVPHPSLPDVDGLEVVIGNAAV